ncbi:MAG: hypothetical protein QM496_01785 [Verrucomicrobiota bacterium]
MPSTPNIKKESVFSHAFGAIGFGVVVYFSHYKDEFYLSAFLSVLYALILWSVVASYRLPLNSRFVILAKITRLLVVIGIIYTGLSHLFKDSMVFDFYVVLGVLGMAVTQVVLCSIPAAKAS